MNNNVKEINHNNIRWINIEKPSRADVEYLKNNFPIHPLDLEDIIAPVQRSKIDKYDNYCFIVLIFPVFNRKTREIESSEIDIFISHEYIITIHNGDIPPLVDLFQLCFDSQQAKINLFKQTSILTLYEILHQLYLYCYPILDHISLDIQNIKRHLFSEKQKGMIEEILITRRNITDMRKIMQSHKMTIEKFMRPDHNALQLTKADITYYKNLEEHSKELWDQMVSFKESIEALEDTNETLISTRLNIIMKTLTIFSVILLPATFVASVFGMNAEHMPFIGLENDFYIILLFTICAAGLMAYFIYRKKWF